MLYYEDGIYKKHKYIANLEVFHENEVKYKLKSYVTDEAWYRELNRECFDDYIYTENFEDLILTDEELERLDEINSYGNLGDDCLCEVIDYVIKNEFPEGDTHKLRIFQLEKENQQLKQSLLSLTEELRIKENLIKELNK